MFGGVRAAGGLIPPGWKPRLYGRQAACHHQRGGDGGEGTAQQCGKGRPSGGRDGKPFQFCLSIGISRAHFFLNMLLHRYFGSHALETLKAAKLKTTRITSFNDPFEFLFVTTGKFTAPIARQYVHSRLKDPEFLQIVAHNFPGLRTAKDPKKFLEKITPLIIANFVNKSDDMMQIPFKMREEMADSSTRIVCFSNSAINPLDEILLWSHYAKMHEGIRIGFEFPKDIKFPFKIYKVDYSEKRLVIDVSQGLSNQTLGRRLLIVPR